MADLKADPRTVDRTAAAGGADKPAHRGGTTALAGLTLTGPQLKTEGSDALTQIIELFKLVSAQVPAELLRPRKGRGNGGRRRDITLIVGMITIANVFGAVIGQLKVDPGNLQALVDLAAAATEIETPLAGLLTLISNIRRAAVDLTAHDVGLIYKRAQVAAETDPDLYKALAWISTEAN